MLITDHFFLFYFFPIFYTLYLLFHRKHVIANVLIIIASALFYLSFSPANIWILFIPLFIDYFLARTILQSRNKKTKQYALTIGLILNLSVLFYFKYAAFVANNIALLPIPFPYLSFFQKNILLPVGISFITFQRISYLMDTYRKKIVPSNNLIEYTTYGSLFPHLLAGPIVRFSQIQDQLSSRHITSETIFEASKYFTIGIFFKIVIADQLFNVEEYLTPILSTLHTAEALILLFYFSFRIYFDFLGYSLMAVGLAKFLGFDFPLNFHSPYQSASITEFWRRWNVTLSSWLRDYLYIPLGGNRKGNIRTYINLLITMLLAGLWHGANWNFLLWGGVHGLFLVIERICRHKRFTLNVPRFLKIIFTFLLISFIWSTFKFTKFDEMIVFYKNLITLAHFNLDWFMQPAIRVTIPSLFIAIFWSFFVNDEVVRRIRPTYKTIALLFFLFLFSLLYSLIRRGVPFIYYQF